MQHTVTIYQRAYISQHIYIRYNSINSARSYSNSSVSNTSVHSQASTQLIGYHILKDSMQMKDSMHSVFTQQCISVSMIYLSHLHAALEAAPPHAVQTFIKAIGFLSHLLYKRHSPHISRTASLPQGFCVSG